MSTHKHTIARNATATGVATVPDPLPFPNLTIYAKRTDLATLLNPDPKVVGSMANVILRITKLEGSVTPPPPTVPGAPTIGTATAGNAQATVSFSPPASTGGSPITSYTVTSTPGSLTSTGASSPRTVTGLTNGTAYTFKVHATNAVGAGPDSSASNSVTPTAAMGNTPPADLQAAINAAASGATINATGGTYSGSFTIAKALTLIGGTINFPTGHIGLTITHSDVVLDDVAINGSQYAHWAEDYAVYAEGTSGSPYSGLVVRNCHIASVGKAGIWVKHVSGAVIHNNLIEDCAYTGVTGFSMVGGEITDNTILRTGYTIPPAELPEGSDAYGINVNDQGAPCSSDVLVSGNTVEDVPTWHGLDTHGGLRIIFRDNIIRRSRRGLFITGSVASGEHATAIVVDGNQVLAPTGAVSGHTPITLASVYGATFTDNTITGWGVDSPPDNQHPWFDYQGQSTGLVDGGGNVVTR